MIAAYVESLKLRVGTFIGMAAVLGYLATAPAGRSSLSLGLLFVVTWMFSRYATMWDIISEAGSEQDLFENGLKGGRQFCAFSFLTFV